MKQLLKILLFTCVSTMAFGQAKPVYERTKTDQLLSDYATWSKQFMLPPTGATPAMPTYIPDAQQDGALWNMPGATGKLKRYNKAHDAWEDVGPDLAGYLLKTGGTLTGDIILPNTIPTNALQAVPKFYVDNLITGITWKNAVRGKTTGNITLSGTQTVDGIALVVGDRALVASQTDATQNGIYVVASGSWARAIDADTGDEILGSAVMVTAGTVNKNTQWTNLNTASPAIGTDNITFGQISASGTYTNGTGLTLTANVFSLNTTYTDARYSFLAGSSSIVTVGTIGTGTWQGTAIADGYVASASTWNAKQNAITLTTSGTSGAATFSGGTLNIPQYPSYTAGNGLSLSSGAFSINPAYANVFTNVQTVKLDDIRTTYTDGLLLTNTVAGTSSIQNQFSPSLRFHSSRYISSVPNYTDATMGIAWSANSPVLEIAGYNGTSITPTYANMLRLDLGSGTLTLQGNLAVNTISSNVGGLVRINAVQQVIAGTPGPGYYLLDLQQTNTLSSGIADAFIIHSTYNQTGSASSTDIHVNRVETALGSGTHLFMDLQVGGVDKFVIDRTGTVKTGIWNGTAIADTYISSASTWNGKQAALSGSGIVKSVSGTISYLTDNSSNWNTAYTQTRQWDGGSTGLTAATGRSSLGLVIGTDVLAYRTFGTAANTTDADLVHIAGAETMTGKKTVTDDFNVNAVFYAATNLAAADLSAFANSSPFGKLLIGQNFSAALGETNFMNSIGNSGSAVGGFRFSNVDWESGVEDLLYLKGDTKSAVIDNLVTGAPTGSSVSTVKIGTVDSMSATLTTTQALTVEINGSTYHIALVH